MKADLFYLRTSNVLIIVWCVRERDTNERIDINTFTWGRPTGGSPWFITTGRSDPPMSRLF